MSEMSEPKDVPLKLEKVKNEHLVSHRYTVTLAQKGNK